MQTCRQLDCIEFEESVSALDVSADTTRVLLGLRGGQIVLWNRATGETQSWHQAGWINSIRFSPDERLAACASQNMLYFGDVASGKLIQRYAGHADSVSSAVFSPDGRTILTGGRVRWDEGRQIAGMDCTLRLWQVPQVEDER